MKTCFQILYPDTVAYFNESVKNNTTNHVKNRKVDVGIGTQAVADPENFGGGDLKYKTSKIRMSSPKLRVIFRPKSEIQTFFSPKIRWSPKKKKGSSPKLRVIFRPKSEIPTFFSPKFRWSPKKKKKGLHQNWDWFFAGLVAFRSVEGDASRNGAELFETEADFSAKIVTFRLVGGMHPPP